MQLLYVGLGGFLGAIARFALAGLAQDLSRSIHFPYGTLTVNILGCLLIGFLSGVFALHAWLRPEWRLFILVGFIGSFTTFSTFMGETYGLMEDGQFNLAFNNVFVHLALGLLAVWVGQSLTRLIWR